MSELIQYKCPCCGGAIEFDSQIQKMKCPYCSTEFEMETLEKYDRQLNSSQSEEMEWEYEEGKDWQTEEKENMRVYVCQSCGGEVVTDDSTAASTCPYCNNSIVMKGQLSGDLKPDLIIPFKLDKQAAKTGLLNHFKGKRLIPKQFKDENHIDEIKGIYVPMWLFDTDVDADILYHATRSRHWSTSMYNYTETKHYSVHKAGKIGFQNVPVDGSSKMADDMMESIEPYKMQEAVEFKTAYLAGYLAERYDVSVEESKKRATKRVQNTTEKEFERTVTGYATVAAERTGVRFFNSSAKYVLCPVWILNTTWEDKMYTFAMNGQTGKFVGDLPLDKKAYYKWLLILTGIIFACMCLFGLFGMFI